MGHNFIQGVMSLRFTTYTRVSFAITDRDAFFVENKIAAVHLVVRVILFCTDFGTIVNFFTT